MKKLFFLFIGCCLFSIAAVAQQVTINGQLTDADTNEPLIGATISIGGGMGAVTDYDGQFSLTLDQGKHILTFSYVSYETKEMEVDAQSDQVLNVKLASENLLNEVIVTADIAIERETPVAFTNISTKKLEEELAAQDIPMVLNSTPGAYATNAGGGDGDARISIRGFDQRNIAVMLDGIPVNDMENGQVFWSNWFGLDLVTQTVQVQRGLGASKLSIPSIGGTINILTKGIDSKRGLRFKQEFGNDGFLRSTLGLTSGRLANGFGISLAGSYKQGDGWVDGNFTKGYFYYVRIDKEIGNHIISASAFGAPQEHGQRSFSAEAGQVDTSYAREIGVPSSAIEELAIVDRGRRFNENWGYKDGKVFNTRKNFYHKPQINLRHAWQINDRMFLSNVAYLSIGKGGGTAREGVSFTRDENDQLDIEEGLKGNLPNGFNPDGLSNTIIRASKNEHFWYGVLSTLNYNITPSLTFSGGIDARSYEGDHYREVYDLLGGSGFAVGNEILQEGGRFDYDQTSFVRWLGGFGLLEYKLKDWSSYFINFSRARSTYASVNNFSGFEIDGVNLSTYTIKTGANFNINKSNSVFFNLGYLDKAQPWKNVIISNNWNQTREGELAKNFENEIIKAVELGYRFGSSKFSANLNSYYTIWDNKPVEFVPTIAVDPSDPESDRVPVNIGGIDALHKGIELDFAFKPIKPLTIEGIVSIGDWKWTSGDTVTVSLPDNEVLYDFDATGVHVGDAAQIQYGGLIRYEPIKSLYFKLTGTYFTKNFAKFQPEDLRGEDVGKDSWRLPAYSIFSFHTGYYFKVKDVGISVRANILNLFDATYVGDARNNDTFNTPSFSDFDAKSASVHYGQGRRFSVSLQLTL